VYRISDTRVKRNLLNSEVSADHVAAMSDSHKLTSHFFIINNCHIGPITSMVRCVFKLVERCHPHHLIIFKCHFDSLLSNRRWLFNTNSISSVSQSIFFQNCTKWAQTQKRLRYSTITTEVYVHTGLREADFSVLLQSVLLIKYYQHTVHRIPTKLCHYNFASNFVKCWPIFKFFSRTDLAVNF